MGIPYSGGARMPAAFERLVRAGMSRRQFVRRSAVAVAGIASLELLGAPATLAKPRLGSAPKPIPGGFTLPGFGIVPSNPDVHVLPPALGFEMSTITDFNGSIAATEIQGNATGSDGSSFTFDTDMRFMSGEYVGGDGRHYNGTFGFI